MNWWLLAAVVLSICLFVALGLIVASAIIMGSHIDEINRRLLNERLDEEEAEIK